MCAQPPQHKSNPNPRRSTDPFFRLSPADYAGLHQRYARILETANNTPSSQITPETRAELTQKFQNMMQALYTQKGANFRIDIIQSAEAQDFIATHATILDASMTQVPMTQLMRQRLQRSNYVFSGFKTFHELGEAFPSLLDSNGNRKPFEQFYNEVQRIDSTYNKTYLNAEYNFIQSSAEMAAKWEQFTQDGDRYNIQYRTVHDDRVRPEHAALDGVTLPITDKFWESYYPPNGWNCRCTAVQVRKSKYPATPHDEAMTRGEEALQLDKKGMFRFNPGKEQRSVPKYNPYTISKCNTCNKAKLASNGNSSDNQLCQACALFERKTDIKKISEEVKKMANTIQENMQASNAAIEIGNMPNEVTKSLQEKRISLQTKQIFMGDKELLHAVRDFKRNLGKAVSIQQLAQFPSLLQSCEVYWDVSHNNLMFITRQDDGVQKFIIQPNYKLKTKEGKKTVNAFITAGKIKENDIDPRTYKRIK